MSSVPSIVPSNTPSKLPSNDNTPSNLMDLITRLKAMALKPDEVQKALFNMIGTIIDIKCEKNSPKNPEVAQEESPDDDEPTESAAETAVETTIESASTFRVILNSRRMDADFSKMLSNQCNGVILSYPTWDILALPPHKFNPRKNLLSKDVKLSDYKVYEIKDGTCCTLYWHDLTSQWTLGSTNGFDVGEYRWMGLTTYWEALCEVLKLYPEFSFDNLSKSKSYTIGFRHHSFHPLVADPQSAWFVQSYDRCTQDIDTNENVGIPVQSAVDVSTETMLEKNAAAMSNYLTSVRDGKPVVHYGYFLRADLLRVDLEPEIILSDIMIESELLKQIRLMIYNLPKGKFGTVLTCQNRMEYTVLRAYLSCFTKFTFINLFPQFTQQYCVYDEFFKKLTAKVIGIMRTKRPGGKVINSTSKLSIAQRCDVKSDIANKADQTAELKITKLANCLVSHIESYEHINAMDSQGINIITDFITDKNYLDLYHACLLI